ncbi:MAG: LysR family transcriptional regulator [Hyphomicrobiales bacterium]
MSLRTVTLKQLRALQAVVDTGTVTGAASILNVTPPAVTTQIRLLEESAGMPLLQRVGDRFRPTDAGRSVLAATVRVEAALDGCLEELELLQGLSGGKVSLGVVSTAKYFAPHAVGAFSRSHPGIEVRLFVGNREDIIRALRDDTVDLTIMGRPPEDLPVERTVLGAHPHILIAAPDHPLAQGGRIGIADVAGETFLMRESGSGTRMLMERLFAVQGISPRIGMEIGSNETIKQAVMAGLGIAFISAHTVAVELADGRLAELDVEGLPIRREWFVVKRSDKRFLPAAAALHDFLVSEGVGFLPTRPH